MSQPIKYVIEIDENGAGDKVAAILSGGKPAGAPAAGGVPSAASDDTLNPIDMALDLLRDILLAVRSIASMDLGGGSGGSGGGNPLPKPDPKKPGLFQKLIGGVEDAGGAALNAASNPAGAAGALGGLAEAAGPIGIAVAAIVGLGAAAVGATHALSQYDAGLFASAAKFDMAMEVLKYQLASDLSEPLSHITEKFTELLQSMEPLIVGLVDLVSSILEPLLVGLKLLVQFLAPLVKFIATIVDVVKSITEAVLPFEDILHVINYALRLFGSVMEYAASGAKLFGAYIPVLIDELRHLFGKSGHDDPINKKIDELTLKIVDYSNQSHQILLDVKSGKITREEGQRRARSIGDQSKSATGEIEALRHTTNQYALDVALKGVESAAKNVTDALKDNTAALVNDKLQGAGNTLLLDAFAKNFRGQAPAATTAPGKQGNQQTPTTGHPAAGNPLGLPTGLHLGLTPPAAKPQLVQPKIGNDITMQPNITISLSDYDQIHQEMLMLGNRVYEELRGMHGATWLRLATARSLIGSVQ